ncbi:MAG TPA: Hpt domain-containing protein [Burkholderiales bacterium]|nr:Hpt domain-containing protein [Burkholderiales bacterium]
MSWQDLGKEFQKLRAEFRGSLPAKLRRLRSLWERIDCEEPDPDALEILQREVHTMAGSAGSFGLPLVSKAAAAAEEALAGLKAGSRPGVKRAAKFLALLDKLDKA